MRISKRIKVVILTSILISLLFIIGIRGSITFKNESSKRASSSDSLVRLHVIANSNSLEDQRIKRQVRDILLKQASKLYITAAKGKKIFDPKAIVRKNLNNLEEIIEAKLGQENKSYGVSLKLGEFQFPTRSYGGMTLVAGKYQALRVVLGAGNGANWWCVLFPPLCFIDSVNEISKRELKRMSFKKENKEEIPVEFKFKLIEVLRENPQYVKSKLRLAHILETSFPGLSKLIFSGKEQDE
ncbi:stage II sporulation protein R [Halobacteroides halobius DSM 5150]|uniref:Stage II sporulation protein R n=1 Tax=Halobacteroides halobius (strain ATCC 35273 / DSM 5150 / MD-1) TaxID=748449 RepID=L0KAQ4_HALHC|nr:stage II sporulation protein R [Halobacteroides halobius]AGB41625.1 stage II sporulation protein R [Halobacteroides halobius DSM 5150]